MLAVMLPFQWQVEPIAEHEAFRNIFPREVGAEDDYEEDMYYERYVLN